jgi:hypothetical protein
MKISLPRVRGAVRGDERHTPWDSSLRIAMASRRWASFSHVRVLWGAI